MRIHRVTRDDRIMEFFKIIAIKLGTSMGSQPRNIRFSDFFRLLVFVGLSLLIISVKKDFSI